MIYITDDYEQNGNSVRVDDLDIDLTEFPYICSKLPYMENCKIAVFYTDKNSVIGLAVVTEDGNSVRINHFEIAESERGNHYGTQFGQELIASLRDEDFDMITLSAKEPSLILFWQKFGFKKAEGREMALQLNAGSSNTLRKLGLEY